MNERKYDGFLPGRHVFEGYGGFGFRFAGMSHRGSVLALPSGIRIWPVTQASEITEDSFATVFAEEPGTIQHLLVGTGEFLLPIPRVLKDRLRAIGISAEPMATGAAARTYNILLDEKRLVAAALIAVA